mgnify:CR=1 FL=1
MTKIIRCDCGVVIRGGSDEELVKGAQAHAKDVHDMEITAEQALSMAEPVA